MSGDQSYCSSEVPALPQSVSSRKYSRSKPHYIQPSRINSGDHSRSFQSNGPAYYSHQRTVLNNSVPDGSTDRTHEALDGFLEDIGSRVSVGIVSGSGGSSAGSGTSGASSASSARSVTSAPQARKGSQSLKPGVRNPGKIRMPASAARVAHVVAPSPGASVSGASVCSSRSGFSGCSADSPSLPSGYKLRCRSLRAGEPLPQGPGWFDVTKGFCGSVNALKKSLLAGQMQFVADVHGYFIRSTRRSIEQHRDVYYLLWREEPPELRPRGEWEGLRKDIKYGSSKYI